jgi:hypothetical protein
MSVNVEGLSAVGNSLYRYMATVCGLSFPELTLESSGVHPRPRLTIPNRSPAP